MVRGRSQKPHGYRPAGGRRGEIEIRGAYARRVWWRNISIAVLGIILLGGAWWLYGFVRGDGGLAAGDEYPVKVRCAKEGCGYEGVCYVKPDDKFPLLCPKCKNRSCNEVWRCRSCDLEFVPDRTRTMVKCPRCGSVSVGSAAVEGPADGGAGGP